MRARAWRVRTSALAGVAVASMAGPVRETSGGDDGVALAQVIDVERAHTLVVGTPAGGARFDRIDAARSGRSRAALPAAGLRTEWRVAVGMALEQAPLVDGAGTTYVVGVRGDVVAIARDGTERWRVVTAAAQARPPALLADGTLVFAGATGEVVAVRDGNVRWRHRTAIEERRSEPTRAGPLPLDDGGVVIPLSRELVVLDADGFERARTTLPEPVTTPLLAALGAVVAVTASGAVWTWTPGAADPTRVVSFEGPIDGSAAMADGHTLVAVAAAQTHLAFLDLIHGSTQARASAPGGSIWLGPPAIRAGTVHVLVLSGTGELAAEVVTTGPSKVELVSATPRLLRARRPLGASANASDGGTTPLASFPHTAPLVDDAGTVAFATIAGDLGVASSAGVELLAEACGARTSNVEEAPESLSQPLRAASPLVAGLAPLGPGVLVAACRSGSVVAVHGEVAVATPRDPSEQVPRAPFPPAGPRVQGGESAVPHL